MYLLLLHFFTFTYAADQIGIPARRRGRRTGLVHICTYLLSVLIISTLSSSTFATLQKKKIKLKTEAVFLFLKKTYFKFFFSPTLSKSVRSHTLLNIILNLKPGKKIKVTDKSKTQFLQNFLFLFVLFLTYH